MRHPWIALLLALVAVAPGETATAAVPARSVQGAKGGLEPFDIKKEPLPVDWRRFIKSSEAEREKLWSYQTGRGIQLAGWAWGWRLGWVRTCATSDRAYCQEILGQALLDKALVVRAEAATRLGRRYEGTGNEAAVTRLLAAYKNPRNLRHGKPLFVQARILFALHRIGGRRGLDEARRLATAQPESRAYWERLEAAAR